MTKRLLASLMSVLMIMTVFMAVPVSAVTTPDLTQDYVADEATRYSNNMVTTGISGAVGPSWGGDYTYGFNGAGGAGSMTYGLQSGNYYYFKPLMDVTSVLTADPTYPAVGFNIKTTAPTGATGRVLYSLTLKDGVSPKAVINIGRTNTSSSPAQIEYPIEYNGVDKGIEPTAAYTAYTGAFADTGASSDKYNYVFGFVKGSAVQATTRFDTAATYIGYEYIYDIFATANDTILYPGKTITVEAGVVNQLGNPYGGNNGITWYATNASRTAEVSGFSIVEGAEGTAQVSIDTTVTEGTYYLVAVADANAELVKGIEITVDIDYSDYVTGDITGNLIDQSGVILAGSYVPDSFSANPLGVTGAGTDDEGYTIWTKADVKETTITGIGGTADSESRIMGSGVGGAYFNKATIDTSKITAGSTIIIGAKVKKDRGTPIISAAIGQNGKTPIFAQEHPTGIGGTSITSTSWQEVSFSLKIPETGWTGIGATNFYFGFAYTGIQNEGDRRFYAKKNSLYFGLEYAHSFDVTADGTELCYAHDEINIDYSLKNQLGVEGNLDQDVTFLVMTPDRNTIVYDSGIIITDNGDGTAKAKVNPFVATGGQYDIVAYSPKYGIAKGVSVTVSESDLVGELTLSDFSGSSVTSTAELLNRTNTPVNGVLVVIMVNEKNQITDFATASITDLTSTDGRSTYTKTLTATDLTKVTKAKAFVLDCGDAETPSLYNSTLKQLAQSVTKAK